jgi:hypothetical protein
MLPISTWPKSESLGDTDMLVANGYMANASAHPAISFSQRSVNENKGVNMMIV